MEKLFQEAILRTILYADIFDYPLKEDEVWWWLIWNPNGIRRSICPNKSEWKKTLGLICHNSDKLGFKGSYYFLPGRQKLVDLRQKRERWSQEKFNKAKQVAQLLKIIPTIKMVAVTGALAWGNCQEDDDIDFLIVSVPDTLWLTRFLATFLLDIFRLRRRPGQKMVRDKICLNMFLDENYLRVPPEEQDLYTAHEVVQLKPLWDRDGVYRKFLADNRWAKKYLPNSLDIRILRYKDIKKKKAHSILVSQYLSIFERLAQKLQLWYMRKRRTTEVISERAIRFHPQDARAWILRKYENRLQKYLNFGS